MTKLILIRGLPGSGKSTEARRLVKERVADRYYEADMYVSNNKTGYTPEALDKAHKWCRTKVRRALAKGLCVVVSNTMSRQWEIDKYLDLAIEFRCDCEIIKMIGEFESTHDVPAEKMRQMRDRWEDCPGEEVREPLVETSDSFIVETHGDVSPDELMWRFEN